MRRNVILAFIAGLGIAVIAAAVWFRPSPADQDRIEVRFTNLQDIVLSHRVLFKKASDEYVPKVQGRIDDLTAPVTQLLCQLPGVAQVDVPLAPKNPADRLIHIRDWHFVPKELFAQDTRAAVGKTLTGPDIDLRYQEFLLQVELVQLEQMALLRCLIKHHGLRRVYSEGFTPDMVTAYKERIAALREAEPHQESLKQQHKDAQDLLARLAADKREGTDRYLKAITVEKEIAGMLEQHQLEMLEIGAAGRLLVLSELDEVLPLDDARLLDAAKPAFHDGKVILDKVKLAQRREAIVQQALAKESVAVIVLGGSHDLTDSVRAVAGDRCEYIRVTVHGYRKFSGEEEKSR